jgi:hypothetical protein
VAVVTRPHAEEDPGAESRGEAKKAEQEDDPGYADDYMDDYYERQMDRMWGE